MNLSRISAVAFVGLGLGVLSVGCDRREEQALGVERDRTVTPDTRRGPRVGLAEGGPAGVWRFGRVVRQRIANP